MLPSTLTSSSTSSKIELIGVPPTSIELLGEEIVPSPPISETTTSKEPSAAFFASPVPATLLFILFAVIPLSTTCNSPRVLISIVVSSTFTSISTSSKMELVGVPPILMELFGEDKLLSP